MIYVVLHIWHYLIFLPCWFYLLFMPIPYDDFVAATSATFCMLNAWSRRLSFRILIPLFSFPFPSPIPGIFPLKNSSQSELAQTRQAIRTTTCHASRSSDYSLALEVPKREIISLKNLNPLLASYSDRRRRHCQLAVVVLEVVAIAWTSYNS